MHSFPVLTNLPISELREIIASCERIIAARETPDAPPDDGWDGCVGPGIPCRKCKIISERHEHPEDWVPPSNRGWYDYWFVCRNPECRVLTFYDVAHPSYHPPVPMHPLIPAPPVMPAAEDEDAEDDGLPPWD